MAADAACMATPKQGSIDDAAFQYEEWSRLRGLICVKEPAILYHKYLKEIA